MGSNERVRILLTFLLAFPLFSLSTATATATAISSCGTISSPGYYTLTQDLSDDETCITRAGQT